MSASLTLTLFSLLTGFFGCSLVAALERNGRLAALGFLCLIGVVGSLLLLGQPVIESVRELGGF